MNTLLAKYLTALRIEEEYNIGTSTKFLIMLPRSIKLGAFAPTSITASAKEGP